MSTIQLQSSRYNNVNVKRLIDELHQQTGQYEAIRKRMVRKERKNHFSCCEIMERSKAKEKAPFNNRTNNESTLFESQLKSIPYMFLSKHKHDGLILPDRAFAKGNAGKRCIFFFQFKVHIKMKDSSVYSFKQDEDSKMITKLNKEEKEKTIISRKLQQWERIVDHDDGKIRAKTNKWFLATRKTFRPPSNPSDMFSRIDPVLEPKEQGENLEIKRESLTRTFSRKKWRPSTQFRTTLHSATMGSSMFMRTGTLKKTAYF